VALLLACWVDLAGAKAGQPLGAIDLFCGLGTVSGVLLALQWDARFEPSFLGSFLADNLGVAFRAVVARLHLAFACDQLRYVGSRAARPVGSTRRFCWPHPRGPCSCAVPLICQHLCGPELSRCQLPALGLHEAGLPLRASRTEISVGGFLPQPRFLYAASAALWPHGGNPTAWRAVAWPCRPGATPSRPSPWCLFGPRWRSRSAAVPFHQWTPERYEGSPTHACRRFLSVGSGNRQALPWPYVCWSCCFDSFDLPSGRGAVHRAGILSMTLGNCGWRWLRLREAACWPTARSARPASLMFGLVCGTEEGFAAMVAVIWPPICFMNLGAYACIHLFRCGHGPVIASSDYAGSVSEKITLITYGVEPCFALA